MSKLSNDPRQPLLHRPMLPRISSVDDKLEEVEQSLSTCFNIRVGSTGIDALDAVGYDAVDCVVRVLVTLFVQLEVYLCHHQYYNKVCRRYAKVFWVCVMCLLELLLVWTVLYPNATSIWPPTWAWVLRFQSLSPRRPRILREFLAFVFMLALWMALIISFVVIYSMLLTYFVANSAMTNLFATDCEKKGFLSS